MRVLEHTNVTIRLTACRNADKGRLLVSRLPERSGGAELFRVRDARAGKGTFDLLKGMGREARMLSQNMSPPERLRTEAWFRTAERPSLVVVEPQPLPEERNDVRRLFVMNLPPGLSRAAAELAVAGRDGLAAEAEIFASGMDRDRRLREIERESNAAARDGRADRLNQCVAWLENDGCARVFLAARLEGRAIGPCGNCGWCLGKSAGYLPTED